jgi:predicted amino acid dehydrogenase
MVECYWPEMTADQVRQVLEQVASTGSQHAQARVRPLGALLVPSDGMVIFLFDGTSAAIQDAAKIAEVPFDRVVEFHNVGLRLKEDFWTGDVRFFP